ncbi:hypothetical protein U879_14545 [Defluviimonas sp. 20V17]|nr:hypothetical protein U879_14545 [Defluviimonas sp. 20V17]
MLRVEGLGRPGRTDQRAKRIGAQPMPRSGLMASGAQALARGGECE